jgi:hypothetical protein
MWFWDLNSEPLEEQLVLLTTEPSLQPPSSTFQIESISNKCVIHKSEVDVKISAEGKAR